MINNFAKIIIKCLFLIYVLDGLPQESYGSEHSDEERSFIRKRSSKPNDRSVKRSAPIDYEENNESGSLSKTSKAALPSELSLIKKKKNKSVSAEKSLGNVKGVAVAPRIDASGKVRVERLPDGEGSSAEPSGGQDLNDETIRILQHVGVDDKGIVLACIASSCLHKEMREQSGSTKKSLKLDFGLVSPENEQKYKRLGGTKQELHDILRELKEERPSPIRNPDFPKQHLYSPVAKLVLSRRMMSSARELKAIRKLPFTAHVLPVTPEADGERVARELRQKQEFFEAEKLRGKSAEDLQKELNEERAIFKEYLEYVERRKRENGGDELVEDSDEEGVDLLDAQPAAGTQAADEEEDDEVDDLDAVERPSGKITKHELETCFLEFVGSKLTHLHVEGYDLYFSPETLDLDRIQKSKITNRDVMGLLGKCPLGADGKPMNFHHLTHYDYNTHKTKSIIVLLTGSIHQELSGLWHFGPSTYRLPRRSLRRDLFNPAREAFNRAIIANLTSN